MLHHADTGVAMYKAIPSSQQSRPEFMTQAVRLKLAASSFGRLRKYCYRSDIRLRIKGGGGGLPTW